LPYEKILRSSVALIHSLTFESTSFAFVTQMYSGCIKAYKQVLANNIISNSKNKTVTLVNIAL
jgi:hypothetical protein